jgi:cytoskeletal protein CcmA (bactofilin family)
MFMAFGSDLRQPAPEPTRIQPALSPQMFQQNSAPSVSPAVKKAAVLGPTLRFKGELSAEEDFVLQGSLEGSITNPQNVTIGTEGSVVGNVKARIITIDGKIEGDLHGIESVVVHATGKVTGNIYAPRIGIVEGAFFSGRIEMVARPDMQGRSPTVVETTPGVPLSAEDTERMLARK